MLALVPEAGRTELKVLCLGAHCDDIDIGCGGTLLTLLGSRMRVSVYWVTFSGEALRLKELGRSADQFLAGAEKYDVIAHSFRDGYFPAQYAHIKEALEALKELPRPDVIFTHRRDDRHQDHRLIAELTWTVFRDHLILEYEIPKFEGDLATPNFYVPLQDDQIERKVQILMNVYASQRTKRWFTADTFRGLARLRGIESTAPSGWAEGFHAPKVLLRW